MILINIIFFCVGIVIFLVGMLIGLIIGMIRMYFYMKNKYNICDTLE